ncbi:MAG: hypothetical protein JSW73_01190 [Candidatus Woesearchaeota archaeon]|nr:MAG: hypothetical protein JSW73_01190 [Candidatus Woesearchaeota archaeon]
MIQLNERVAEETGIHIGDGSMSIYNGIPCYTVACNANKEREYVEKYIAPLIKEVYGIKPKLRMWSEGAYGFRIVSREVIEFKNKELGLPLGPKKEIEIPFKIIKNMNLAKKCIRGLFDTDGCVYIEEKKTGPYPRIELHLSSKKVVKQVSEILKDLGLTCSIWEHKYPNKKNWSNTYTVCTRGTKNLNIWMKQIGFKNPKNIKKVLAFTGRILYAERSLAK